MVGTTGIYIGKYQTSWKGKLELIFISDSSTYYDSIYFDLPTTPSYHHVSLALLYCDPSCCRLTVPNYYILSDVPPALLLPLSSLLLFEVSRKQRVPLFISYNTTP